MFTGQPILLGQYRPSTSYLHVLDSRAKILPVVLVLVLALMTTSMFFYLTILTALILSLLFSGIGWRQLVNSFQPVLFLVAITFVYHILFSAAESEPIFSVAGWTLTKGAVSQALFFSLRLVLFVSIAFLLTLTSSPSHLAEAMTKLLRPLSKFKVPINDLGLILFIAIRFIPILYEEFEVIRHAQMMRGVTFTGSWMVRVKKTSSILLPVFIAAISRADDLALAIEARGYDSRRPRTFYSTLRLGPKEWWFMLGSAAGIFLLFWVTR